MSLSFVRYMINYHSSSTPPKATKCFNSFSGSGWAALRGAIIAAVVLIASVVPGSAHCQTTAAPPPAILPVGGTYYGVQTITMSSPTPGVYFHYTTDGTAPTLSSPWYGGPFKISGSVKVQAVAFAYGYSPSSIASSKYDVILPAPPPTIAPAAGSYKTPQTVTFKSSTPGVYYHYTTDGTTPTLSSTWYSGPFKVSSNQTIKAVAFAYNYSESSIATSTFSITPPATTPVILPASATYKTIQSVTMSDATPGAVIYYTTNGTNPSAKSARYTGPITVRSSTNFFAAAEAPGGSLSPVVKAFVDIILPTTAPVISPSAGTYNKIQSVTLTDATPGATIYYTTDGTYPSASSPKYSVPINATNGMQITTYATAPGYSTGSSSRSVYTIVAPPPSISPSSGTLQKTARVTITDAVPGATIYYTRDGSVPTTSSPVYGGPITVSPAETSNEVFHAIAAASGYRASLPTMATFTVDLPAGTLARATVGLTPTRSIPADYLGISTDWSQPPLMMGQASTGVNYAYRTLLKNLTVNATAPMLFRITGDDSEVSDIQGAVEPLAELAQAVNVHYILGVDMWKNDVALAQAETSAWMTGIPNDLIHAFEIGNEPDVYPFNGARPSNYSWANYVAQFQQWKKGIDSTTGGALGTMATSMGAQTDWVPSAQSATASGALNPTILSQHSYLGGLTQTSGEAWPADYLLRPVAATEFPAQYSGFAESAHKSGRVFRMSEINSFFNGGVPGLSNTFESALWSIDVMFNFLKSGMDGVNWHSGQGAEYQLFQFHPQTFNGTTTYPITQVAPLYYGLLVFSQVAEKDAQLLPVSTTTTANVSIWATVDSASTTHVIVINKDEAETGDVQITLPGYSTATVRYLIAASYAATNGVTFGGQTFDGSQDGTIQGSLATTTITASYGIFTLHDMPITSAAVMDVMK